MMGFKVLDAKTYEIMLDRFAETEDGELWKQDAHGKWEKVPERRDYIVIPYNQDGRGEVW